MAPQGKITTLLFDCDNTLVLSEEIAFEACAEVANEFLEYKTNKKPDPPLQASDLIRKYVGMNFRGMMLKLQEEHKFDLSESELDKYAKIEMDRVIARLKVEAKPCIGVDEVLAKVAPLYKMSIVSSSAQPRVLASIEKVGQDKYFKPEVVFSAATSLPKPTSKPDPAIYLHAIDKLDKKATECVAIEDSKSGATSAFRAGIPVIGYVGPYPDDKKAEMRKVLKDVGCEYVMDDWSEFLGIMEKMQ